MQQCRRPQPSTSLSMSAFPMQQSTAALSEWAHTTDGCRQAHTQPAAAVSPAMLALCGNDLRRPRLCLQCCMMLVLLTHQVPRQWVELCHASQSVPLNTPRSSPFGTQPLRWLVPATFEAELRQIAANYTQATGYQVGLGVQKQEWRAQPPPIGGVFMQHHLTSLGEMI
eukprot:320552-Chlamydomonas_euryale.AAC.7